MYEVGKLYRIVKISRGSAWYGDAALMGATVIVNRLIREADDGCWAVQVGFEPPIYFPGAGSPLRSTNICGVQLEPIATQETYDDYLDQLEDDQLALGREEWEKANG